MSIRNRLIHGTKWSLIGAVIAQGLGLLVSIIIAQVVGKTGFGQYGIIQSTISTFGVFAGMALGITSTKYVAELRISDPIRAGRFIGLPIIMGLISSLIISVIFFALASSICVYILNDSSLTILVRLSMPLLLLNTLNNIQMSSLAGLESFKKLSTANAIVGILTFPCITIGVRNWGLEGAICGLVISRILAYVILQIYLTKECRNQGVKISYCGLLLEWKTIWNFSVPTFLAGTIVGPATWICNIMLVRLPDGYAQMGIYNATLQWQNAVRFLPLRVLDVSLPVLSNLYGSKDFNRYYRALKASLLSITGATLIVTIPLMFFSKYIMKVFGKDFTEGGPVLNLMLIAAVLHMTARILSQVAQSRGRAWMDFLFCTILSAALVIAWVLLTHKGAFGLALATCISYFLINVGLCIYVLKVKRNDISNTV